MSGGYTMRRFFVAFAALIGLASVAHAQPLQSMPVAAFPTQPGPYSPATVFVPVIAPWGWGVGWGYQTYNPWTGYSYVFGGVLPPAPVVAPVVPTAVGVTSFTAVPAPTSFTAVAAPTSFTAVPASATSFTALPAVPVYNTVPVTQAVVARPVYTQPVVSQPVLTQSIAAEVVTSGESPAELRVQFPASADVWVNGQKVEGSKEQHVLTSPMLVPGEQYVFEVKGQWTSDGKKYESTRRVVLGAGDRSGLIIVSGDAMRE
jgi:uncharacterized protein (TIGR03000 family)